MYSDYIADTHKSKERLSLARKVLGKIIVPSSGISVQWISLPSFNFEQLRPVFAVVLLVILCFSFFIFEKYSKRLLDANRRQ